MPYVPGAFVHGVTHVADVYKSSNVFANNVPIALWDAPGATSAIVDGIYIPDDPYKPAFAAGLAAAAGANAMHDDPDSEVKTYPGIEDSNVPSIENPETDTKAGRNKAGIAVACGNYATDPIDYNQQLSKNFTIKSLSVGALFSHNIVAQNSLSVGDIICNLKGVAENILEPLNSKYPGLRINSGFRKGTSTSQHNKGMAVDVQWPGLTPAGYTPIAQWIRDNLPFDQLIFEHGNNIWLHISYNRVTATQRNALLTYYPKVSPQYKPGLTNHYA
jgi:hypothetical protein